MKKIILGAFLLVSFLTSAQCVKSAIGFGNNNNIPRYNVAGDVSVSYENNEITLTTGANYSTASGPDVRVYLANSQGRSTSELAGVDIRTIPNIPFGLIGFSGVQKLIASVPDNVNLEDYDTVYFYCFQFSQFWDFGKIDPIKIEECSLSFSNLEKKNEFKTYPNPVVDVLNIDGDVKEIDRFVVYDMMGRVVLQSSFKNNQIDFSSIAKGVYNLVLFSDSAFEVEKIVKM